jgi:hypothetical protein
MRLLIVTFFFSLFVKLQAQSNIDSIFIEKINQYKNVELSVNLSQVDRREIEGLKYLIRASRLIDEIFKNQAYNVKQFPDTINNSYQRQYYKINYGPWDRLDNNLPFIAGVVTKPLGANFYPSDMSKSEFDSLKDDRKNSPYTIIVRENGELKVKPYSEAYKIMLTQISNQLKAASKMFSDPDFSAYLSTRAVSLLSDDYITSDKLWMDMKNNAFDYIVGPIETYEDKLYGIKTSFEAYVLIKDIEWSEKLEIYLSYLIDLQKKLPVDAKFKKEMPGDKSQIGVYDAVYYAGECNAGSKTMAINLPNDEKLQNEKGTKRIQIKNVLQAKFEHILMPIADIFVDSSQLKHITFNAFFTNVMFHEIAHGLGIKNTINNKGTVQSALGANYNTIEESKADILGLYMVTGLFEQKVLKEGELMDYYVTFMASIFRSVRFGASSAHGKANMFIFNYLKDNGAFVRNNENGTYMVDVDKMKIAIRNLSKLIIELQGNGDSNAVSKIISEKGVIHSELNEDLKILKSLNIPIDLLFTQGDKLFDNQYKIRD